MEAVSVYHYDVISLDRIAEGIEGLRVAFVNVFGLTNDDGSWILVDTGIPHAASRIEKWAVERFAEAPSCIVLTHGHFDHASNAFSLADKWDVPIYADTREFPYLTGHLEYPAPNAGAGGGMMSLLSPLYPRLPIDLGSRLMPLASNRDSTLPGNRSWRIVRTPGHTPGHVSFFREQDRVLVVGDAFCTTKPESFFEAAIAQSAELHGPPAYFTSDWNAAHASVDALASLKADVIAPGHGRPLSGPGVAESVCSLAANFNSVAIPNNSREAMAS